MKTPNRLFVLGMVLLGSLVLFSLVVVTSAYAAAPDFSISASPNMLTIAQGGTGSSTITLTSLNGFAGSVFVTQTSSIPAASVFLTPGTVAVPNAGTGTATLTVSPGGGLIKTPPGMYTITVTGTFGTITHTTTVTVTVTAIASGVPEFPLASVGMMAMVAAMLPLLVLLRRRNAMRPA
jgi:hypothetical protein